jgi:hypothetical protein
MRCGPPCACCHSHLQKRQIVFIYRLEQIHAFALLLLFFFLFFSSCSAWATGHANSHVALAFARG